ncbi:NAD(P)H-dependent glycerol-3-phosphate dehydrogenase [Desulfosudis oleivorans]|uniref:Glycerol-3-phosphate dehydrogenase [NAD(P)+] n=1 Tax=Desulfosudis oleivorans (strain DSM 6200 / JCM 39069 / Hxd3) TaxID=96561 RepID=A8ZUS1_DESOH|nr:NAD(P)H-dependent glycerol-3-phosphate dehydrogenase [Desulfosudis oleivorans]ABW66484.1 Glycerol-3-phosphate dehydrogenase (NAD(P)(+)) [Desulfosudis oleivorans Hxd3]
MSSGQTDLRVAVVGAGSWGTAIAHLLASKGLFPLLWAYEPELCEQIEKGRENTIYLPGIQLAEGISVSNDLGAVVADRDIVVMVVPSHLTRDVAARAADHLDGRTIVVTASKGIENKTHLTMTGVLSEVLPNTPAEKIAVLSGPSFAREVAANLPTVVAVASTSTETALFLQQVFAAPLFRVYTNDDPVGVELGGAVKNVIAIASGVCDGLGLGLSARAAMITRGLAEMRRLGMALGANPHTFSGLAGIGDLILTCTGSLSRNYTVGKKLGEGMTIDEILASMRMVAEGVKTAKSVFNLSNKRNVEMPICHEVYRILYEGLAPGDAVLRLMTRTLKHEIDDEVTAY